jgi:hypothetical protein
MNEQILALELRFLILRYSRRRIIDALAKLGDQTAEEVERELGAALDRKSRSNTKKRERRPTSDLIGDACRDRPEIAEIVTILVSRFENRSFLPQLRDVVRFLDRAGVPHPKLTSRQLALPRVVRALAGLDAEELQRLVASPEKGESDLAVLAREIMAGGRSRRPPKDSPQ